MGATPIYIVSNNPILKDRIFKNIPPNALLCFVPLCLFCLVPYSENN